MFDYFDLKCIVAVSYTHLRRFQLVRDIRYEFLPGIVDDLHSAQQLVKGIHDTVSYTHLHAVVTRKPSLPSAV